MNDEKENVELYDDEEIVTLYDENDQPVDFIEVACVDYDGDFYALLEPVEPMEGLEEGDVLIFKIIENENGEDTFEPVADEELLNAVFEEYLRHASEHECGCGCDECGHDCCGHDHEHECDCDDCKD